MQKNKINNVIVFCLHVTVVCGYMKHLQDNETYERERKIQSAKLDNDIVPRIIHHPPTIWQSHNSEPHFRHKNFPEIDPQHCQKPAKCETLNYTKCLGATLPYSKTTLDLIDLNSQDIVQEKLELFKILKNVPKCWTAIQPFLCSLYMPRCENDKVDLPSKELCRNIFGPCKIFANISFFSELNCEDERLFRTNCKNVGREIKFHSTGQCLEPLIQTDSSPWFYDEIEGCGLHCKNPLYTDNEHAQIHKLVAWGAGTCLIFNVFTVFTFIVDWKTANKYPALVIFYINCCFLVSCVGWLAQFYGPDSRDDIVCKKDGTLRMSEPSGGENLSCVIVFVLVYYSLMAGMVWFVILTYSWHMSFQALGKIQERIDKKRAYFHLVAWSLPLVLTITTMAIGEIDGDSISGICFVGYVNPAARGGLLLGPLAGVLLVGGYFLLRGLITLIRLKIGSREIISARASRKISSTIVRMGLFSVLTFLFGVITFVCHIYHFMNEDKWKTSLRKYILCRLINPPSEWIHCKQTSRPSVSMLQLHLLALFVAGIVMSSWVWTHSTIEAWTRCIRRKFDCEVEEPIKLQKHKVIAQAFAKRKMLYNAGRLSITFHRTHTDPVGLNFDLNSVASNDLSSTWAAALPKLVNRRGALTGAATGSVSSQRRNSMDSEVSFSYRKVSVESRRNSVDSQLSVQIAELKTTRKVNSRRRRNRNRRGREFSSRRVSKNGPLFSRRESSTSLDSHSQLGAHLLNALAMGNTDLKAIAPNLKRRTANAGLEGQEHINNLLSKGKLVVPFQITGDSEASEDENVSMTISESKFNLVVNGQTNEMVMKSLRRGLNIEEISTDEVETKKSVDRRSYSRSDRESRQSKRSHKKERRKSRMDKRKSEKYETNTDESYREIKKVSDDGSSDNSFCPELSKLAVQSSYNSGVSVGTQHNCEKNRGSKQSKTSIDVGVQANAREIATQTQANFDSELTEPEQQNDEIRNSRSKSQCVSQGTQMSPKSIRSSRDSPLLYEKEVQTKCNDNKKKSKQSDNKDLEKNLERVKKNKQKYRRSGNDYEMETLNKHNKTKKGDAISYENEKLLNDKYNVKILKKKT